MKDYVSVPSVTTVVALFPLLPTVDKCMLLDYDLADRKLCSYRLFLVVLVAEFHGSLKLELDLKLHLFCF